MNWELGPASTGRPRVIPGGVATPSLGGKESARLQPAALRNHQNQRPPYNGGRWAPSGRSIMGIVMIKLTLKLQLSYQQLVQLTVLLFMLFFG